MSNPKCFLQDICGFKIADMECMDIVKSEEILEPQDEHQKVEKLKESHLLLKKKLSLSHELIRQYNDKVKECQDVSMELKSVKDNLKKVILEHNSSLSKIKKLEIENEIYRQKVENHTKVVSEQHTQIAADQQHVLQLQCKVRELEQKEIIAGKAKKDDCFKEKVKILDTKLRTLKESHKLEIKQMEIKLRCAASENAKIQTKNKEVKISHEKATCTSNELEPVIIRPKTEEKCTLTNEFYSVKDDPYPLFCSKCLIKLDPVPLDQIFKHMTYCPTMITEVPSPSKESEINKPYRSPRGFSRTEFPVPEIATSNNLNNLNQSLISNDVSKSDFQRLERKLYLLERKLHKKTNKELQGRNLCCGFQYPNNCYLGPYPNLFQPGAMIRSQSELFQFQSWQNGLRNPKRSRKSSIQRPNRRGTKSKKKLKLDDGTSEWNVDSVSSREFIDSDNENHSENDAESLKVPLRTEFSNRINNSLKRRKVDQSCPTLRRRKRDKIDSLFTSVCSRSPKFQDDTDEENNREAGIESSKVGRVLNETFSDEEMIEDSIRAPEDTVEYETVECETKKRGKGAKKPAKTSTKRSLVTKIRNLKKNCNKIKPLTGKTGSVNDITRKLSSDQTSGTTVAVNKLQDNVPPIQPVRNDLILNGGTDYCPVKKHRIAHCVRKQETDAFCVGGKNSFTEVPETNFEDKAVKDDVKNDTPNESAEGIEKLNSFEERVEITVKDPKPVVRIERKNSLKDSADTNCSRLVKKPAIKHFQDEPVAEIATDETKSKCIMNGTLNPSQSVVDKTLPNKKAIPLQPCVMIPKMYLDIEGVENPCKDSPCEESNEAEEDEFIANLSLNTDKLSNSDASLRILRSKSKIIKSNEKVSSTNESTIVSKGVIDKSSTLRSLEAIPRTMKVELIRCGGPPESSDNEIDAHDTSMSVHTGDTKQEILENDETAPVVTVRKYKKRTRTAVLPVSPMRELRSRRRILSASLNLEEKNSTKDGNEETNNELSSKITQASGNVDRCSEGLGPKALIKELLTKRANSQKLNSCSRKRSNEKLQQRKENLVLKELSKLCKDAEWKQAVLLDTIERLSQLKTHTIAKCTIDFLVARAEEDEELDRTHTPPAPLLSKTQQRVLTMLVALNRTMPNIIELVQAGIEFKLFRLGHAPEVNVIEGLVRVFTALARIQKDREKVRILCCDALYCLGLKAMPLIYVVLSSWAEVFPMAGTSSDPLLLCLISSIMTQNGDTSFPKFFTLKKLLTGYYGYESSGYDSKTLAKDWMTTLKEKRENGLDTAIIILAKKQGTVWTYDNVVQGLLQMIIEKTHPSIYDAFRLLGHLMRSFPVEDKDGVVKNILEQLCALMESGEGSMQQQEGVATALLSLHRHRHNVVAEAILNWEPSEPLSELTSRQITALFDSHQPSWWNKLLSKNCTKLSRAEK